LFVGLNVAIGIVAIVLRNHEGFVSTKMVVLHTQENWQDVPYAQPDEMTMFAYLTLEI
jgi:hypothetical protein